MNVLQGNIKNNDKNPFDPPSDGVCEEVTPYDDPSEDWPDPEPIIAKLSPVERLTEEMLPDAFKDWVLDAAERLQVQPDFIAAPLLIVCGAIIGTACRIRPKQKDDWDIVPNLWGGIVGPPSVLKTPALNEAVNKTVGRLEAAAREDHKEAVADYEAGDMVRKATVKALKKEVDMAVKQERENKLKGKTATELVEELRQLQGDELPTERRYKTNDSSIEKIVELLNQNPRGLLYFRDELIALFKRMERTGNEQDRAFMLESWNGSGSHTDDRIGRGTVRTDNLCISLLGGIQPDKIAGYLNAAISEGDNDGFVQRMQMMVYPDVKEDWEYLDQWPDTEARNRAFSVIEKLANLELDGDEPYLRFTVDGQEVFKQWITWLQTEKLRNSDDHSVITEHLAKYRSLMPSLALIFHIVDAVDTGKGLSAVSAHAASMAAAWCQYLESHARRIYNLSLDMGQAGAARLARKIQEGKLGREFKRHQVVSKKWGLLGKKEHVQSAIDHLVEMGWLRQEMPSAAGEYSGRPGGVIYSVNPKIKF